MPNVWRKTLVYLGLVEDDELEDYGYDDQEAVAGEWEEPVRRRPRSTAPVRAVGEGAAPSRRDRDAVVRPMPGAGAGHAPRLHLVLPRSFNEAQEVGDKFRDGFSVIMNLQGVDAELARRLVDFASGLCYGLRGSMQPVADKVFLLTPAGIAVSAEERRRFLEERGFFNQA